jgi:hypothetical protein
VASIDARRALAYAQEAQEIASTLGDSRAKAESLYLQGQCADLLLDHATALDAFAAPSLLSRNAATTAQSPRHCAPSASCTMPSAIRPGARLQFRALAIDQRTGNDSSRAATLRMIGVVYSRTAMPHRASISIGAASRFARTQRRDRARQDAQQHRHQSQESRQLEEARMR